MVTNTICRLLVAFAAVVVCVASAGAQTLDELFAKAKQEGALVIYAGGPVAIYEPLAREFESKFSGVKVSITGGFSNVLNQQIQQQMQDHKLQVDMGLFQTVQDFVRWKADGKLLSFKPDGLDKIDAAFKDADGAYTAWFVSTLSYAYNTQQLKSEDVPKTALDFLKPQFRGKLIAVYPHDDDAALYLFHTIVQKYGWDWMEKYMANQPAFIQGHLGVARGVASGAQLATLDATTSTVLGQKRANQPIEFAFSDTDPTPLFTSTAGIFKDAPHPNAARLYLIWLLQPEQQRRNGAFSPRSDVPPPGGLKPLLSYNVANAYRDFVTNDALIADLRRRFEAYTGPIRNVGGVR